MSEQPQGLKDRKLQEYYEELASTYGSKGWAFIISDLEKLHDEANTLNGIESMEGLHFRRGQIDIIKKIVAQPAIVAAAYQMLLDGE